MPNKLTRTIKEAFERAFHHLQGAKGPAQLEEWARANPTEFYRLAARLIPTEIKADVTSDALADMLLEARKRTGK